MGESEDKDADQPLSSMLLKWESKSAASPRVPSQDTMRVYIHTWEVIRLLRDPLARLEGSLVGLSWSKLYYSVCLLFI